MSEINTVKHGPWVVISFLAVVTVVAYWHLFTNDFINFDDDIYITHNYWVTQGLSADSIRWAFGFTDKHGTYWQPLTWLSLMLDYELFKLNPAGYHLENLFLHIACAAVLFQFLRNVTGALWRPALVAALFALHPINVENVAWAVERKSILSALFFMLALRAYAHYVHRPSLPRYLAIVMAMTLGLMAKSMIVTLPCVLLLLDYWPLQRIRAFGNGTIRSEQKHFSRLLLEKLPLFSLSCASVAISVYSLKADPMRAAQTDQSTLVHRAVEAVISCARYLGKMIWPTDLAVFYPSMYGYPAWQLAGSALLLLVLTLFVLFRAKKEPWLVTGWLWYLGMLLPVSGLMRAGLWPAMADRFAYLPFIGLFIAIVWSLSRFASDSSARQTTFGIIACAALAGLGLCTWQQAGYWKTSRTLFSHALKAAPDNFVSRNNYGHGLLKQGRAQEAEEQFRLTLQFRPNYEKAHFNLAQALEILEEPDEAMIEYRATIRLNPNFADAHVNLGKILATRKSYAEARQHFEAALRQRPKDPVILSNLGMSYADTGLIREAERYFREAITCKPEYLKARLNLAELLVKDNRDKEANDQYREILRLSPGNVEAKEKLAHERSL